MLRILLSASVVAVSLAGTSVAEVSDERAGGASCALYRRLPGDGTVRSAGLRGRCLCLIGSGFWCVFLFLLS